jgi:uncharacterized RDD family membrane protein YckC
MSTTDPSVSWGAEALGRLKDEHPHARSSARSPSLLGARMAAIIIDGLVLLVPVLAIAFVLSLIFPHHGFFLVNSGTSTTTSASGTASTASYTLPLPGLLLITALSLSYFFLCEALREQTVGKRAMGLRVRSASGGSTGSASTSSAGLLPCSAVLVVAGSATGRVGRSLCATMLPSSTHPTARPGKLPSFPPDG